MQVKQKSTQKPLVQCTAKQFGGIERAALATRIMVDKLAAGHSAEYIRKLKADHLQT